MEKTLPDKLLPDLNKILKDELLKCNEQKEDDFKLNFITTNIKEIKQSKGKAPLKPCITCFDYVNYPTHSPTECALFRHKKINETISSAESGKSDDEEGYFWRKPGEMKGFSSSKDKK